VIFHDVPESFATLAREAASALGFASNAAMGHAAFP
jgi:hypothetical protein